ncbi:origin recognition complex subunit 4 [Didymosphaeria variabile]|uniref:Origin recognition complex subunit 4 n=1 Tax=Didymosphaeria variabile TaxID=1932322 RepID=A0A9W8XXR2_9PLEO|nr:origin recognition complex subunit 4 [Didymosphaeria variabile]KAJ4360059.1 origin recognition complex subunit 4 [Didymosphaeria variabile]
MADTPRASKRRKLDTATRNAPSPLAKPSTVRESTRPTSRTAYKADGSPKEQDIPLKNASKPLLRKVHGTVRQREAGEDADVWDDIEGALGESPTKRLPPRSLPSTKKRVTRNTAVADATNERTSTDELPKATPSRRKGKATFNEYQGDLAEEVTTPARRASARAAPISLRRTPKDSEAANGVSTKPGSLRKPLSSAKAERKFEFEDTMLVSTSSSRHKRARQLRFRDNDTIPETDDEPEKNGISAPRIASARRQILRPDNVITQSEEAGDADEDEDIMSVDGNSVLESVLDPTEPSPFNKPSSAQKQKPDVPLLSGFIETGRELDLLKNIILERISGKRPVPLVGLDDAYKSVHQLIENTVTAGEGNSMLLIGTRGSGKTALVNKALIEVSKDNSHDYHVVRLNGFIHTDDKIALREIWRQLGKEMELEEESGGVGKSYADALQTLLALLSHPSEHTGEYTEKVANAVVFVMDEFDLFAQHPRQTLLYNLFDIAQSRKAPIAVLGLTTHIDVANSLEKRVKSRFSHRYVHISLAKTFTAFQEICKANLLVQPEFLSVEERGVLESAVKKKASKQAKKSATENVLSQWNSNINTLFSSKAFLTTHLARLFYRSKSVPTTLTTFLLPTANLTTSLSVPLDIIHDSDTCNFHMAYDEYVTLASKARIQSAAGGNSASGGVSKVWGKEVARREWEGLLELELVMPAVGGGLTGGFSMVKCDVSLEEVGAVLAGEKGIEKGLERWCRQI